MMVTVVRHMIADAIPGAMIQSPGSLHVIQ